MHSKTKLAACACNPSGGETERLCVCWGGGGSGHVVYPEPFSEKPCLKQSKLEGNRGSQLTLTCSLQTCPLKCAHPKHTPRAHTKFLNAPCCGNFDTVFSTCQSSDFPFIYIHRSVAKLCATFRDHTGK